MQKYSYRAMNPQGKIIKGKLIASSPEELKSQITKNGLYCVSFNVDEGEGKAKKRMDPRSLLTLCNQLGSMLKAGLSIANALEMLYSRIDSPAAKKALGIMYESVQKGNSLSDAIVEMGNTFPPIMANMIKAGELSGELDKTLKNLGTHFENENKLNNQIKSAMRYPIMLLSICAVVAIGMVVFILPKMTASMGDNIPKATAILLKASDFFKKPSNLIILGAVVAFFIVIFPIIKKIPSVRYSIDKMKLTLPKFGPLIKQIYTSRFAGNLATLYDNGIELIEAMNMCSRLMNNAYVTNLMNDAIEKVKKGESISSAMSAINVFDPLLISMIYVGEESGVLGEVLGQTATYFDEESSFAIKKLVGLINPIMMIVMALVVGYIMMAVMSPIFSMYKGTESKFTNIMLKVLTKIINKI
jgi:type IV pilus assembly protein PilC